MPAEKTASSKASEARRSNKPLMEKRRRARINHSLTELKTLILNAVKKDNSKHSKLEKADILEMTVKYLQNLQRQQLTASADSDTSSLTSTKFSAGYGECANEVTRYLEGGEGHVDATARTHLINHLSRCMNGLKRTATSTTLTATNRESTTEASTSTIMDAECVPDSVQTLIPVIGGVQLIPMRLANGQIAFILPTFNPKTQRAPDDDLIKSQEVWRPW
uniref:Hairy-enhancer-of-split 1 n=2 Tax=Strigamia maritima TaxID=126957 RepID=A9XCM7_STRMM|nr:hairy-enhancer-of-split 1 [Strigamia maritima]